MALLEMEDIYVDTISLETGSAKRMVYLILTISIFI
jgi:hypothetical protein